MGKEASSALRCALHDAARSPTRSRRGFCNDELSPCNGTAAAYLVPLYPQEYRPTLN
ncbi:hypothetical protein GQ53DRAFT_746025 [Thozetella sp. PMI_491]|nr:hypothetical protein GQ53DRAFT_746025 [Thozetella sp. PMI_491]